ncbi:aspartyl protease family protein 1-like [Cornus florida]|uniref:aspartyl protease family protein 1-like n=1 Tax=Cornus florida TaxID=4283 RepID=UPI00289C75C2|nr:aspartyl protease family protein 1-like [Cornus florida]
MASSSSSYLVFFVLIWGLQSCNGSGTFGFNMYHRYSEPVKSILGLDGLPEKGSPEYCAAMIHRDRERRLASTPLTFVAGNKTLQIPAFGFLQYANISVGTPSLSFLVALDTGSDLFWLPCDCMSCVHSLKRRSGEVIDLNIYSPNTSSTSMNVPCNSTLCSQQRQCSATNNTCPYQLGSPLDGPMSIGILVEDDLHLSTDDSQLKAVDARITFGCGMIQTGSYLKGLAPNGLFGLGMDNISVPSMLASEGLAANSFSMCFGPDGIGRISFGDKGAPDQAETPFNLNQSNPIYNISMTQIAVDKNVTDLNFDAIFDSGATFTQLNDPAYTAISESFNSQVKEKRHPSDSNIPFEYCYELSENQTTDIPNVNLTMKGGNQFFVTDPIVLVSLESEYLYCLGVVKSWDVNIIGLNFMTGYRVVFDREKMVLGWKASECYDARESSVPTAVPPTMAPGVTSGSVNGSPAPSASSMSHVSPSNSSHFTSFAVTLFTFLSLLIHSSLAAPF